MPSYIDSYYTRTLQAEQARPSLSGTLEADVCIIGGGLAGITAALELLRLGRSVILLEAKRVAWGASGRNGGVVSPGYSNSFQEIARVAGLDNATSLYRMSIEGVQIVADNIQHLAMQQAHATHGTLRVCRYENADQMQAQREWLAREFQYQVEFKSREALRDMLATDTYRQALYDPHAFHFHPLNYAQALVAEIERLGGQVFEGSEVLSAACDLPVKLLKTAQGSVKTGAVVFTCGGHTGNLIPKLASSYLPIATYMLLTEAAKTQIASAIRTSSAIGDSRRASDYYRLVDGGERILWGGMITTRTSEPRRLAEVLRKRMVDTYPQLEGIKVDVAWSGLMSYARHLMPLIGQLKPGVWYCMGFGGHGMNTTAIGGKVVAQGIAGETDRYRQFAPFGLVWNGGMAGTAAVQMTYWYYQLMDFIQEQKSNRQS
ncbi:NAD(P)/FAD-dependent oxidoreductase [Collimonas antrihumi]|uniref:NAD(P)/FAD-dependent oxidoreductase n=1 Tax=Collimonas antrihumi TaxID=1940615 RepID=UPI001B8CBDC3|nr:FAD-binding oxidoreductase [Collimonas antrihumi]